MAKFYFFQKSYHRLFLFVFFCSALQYAAVGQENFKNGLAYRNANIRWFFTHPGSGLSFENGAPQALNNTGIPLTHFTVSDPKTKALQFYTDGQLCYNANYQVMQNGSGIIGDWDWYLGYAVVPVIGSSTKYYLFSVLNISDTFSTLYYSVIDMELDNGLGGIAVGQKNMVLARGNFTRSLLVVPGDDCDVWLMTHTIVRPEFKAFHITREGISPTPVVSVTGGQMQGYSRNNGYGDAYKTSIMCAAPDRSMITTTSFSWKEAGGILISKFNSADGTVSNSLKITDFAYVCTEFSPDSRKLYAVSGWEGEGLLQWSLSSIWHEDTLAKSKKVVAKQNQYGALWANALKLYGDTIYMTSLCRMSPACDGRTQKLSIITNPNGAAKDAGFLPDAIEMNIPQHPQLIQLGGEIVHPIPPDTLFRKLDTLICSQDSVFPLLGFSGNPIARQYLWNNGDTTASIIVSQPGVYRVVSEIDFCSYEVDSFIVRQSDISFSLGPDVAVLCGDNSFHILSIPSASGYRPVWQDGSTGNSFVVMRPGSYWLTLTNRDGCSLSDTIVISERELLPDLGPDQVLCNDEVIQLTFKVIPPTGTQPLWSTGSHDASITVAQIGSYWVEVKDSMCSASDTVNVIQEMCNCVVQAPNAFSPNGDGNNDVFRPVIETGCFISAYSLHVYNRYGQLVFTAFVPELGWDGTYAGKPAEMGTYFFYLTMQAGTSKEQLTRRGDIVLIR